MPIIRAHPLPILFRSWAQQNYFDLNGYSVGWLVNWLVGGTSIATMEAGRLAAGRHAGGGRQCRSDCAAIVVLVAVDRGGRRSWMLLIMPSSVCGICKRAIGLHIHSSRGIWKLVFMLHIIHPDTV